ncbi:MAG: hypothetical protein M9894_09385 [Planctomycetes bacterium]|nr:hypothetical protein [Planctomycetota bacterium]
MRRLGLTALSLVLAALVWLPCLHLVYGRDPDASFSAERVTPRARALAARHLALWSAPDARAREVARMRATNAEWDFMGRTFLVLALANMAAHDLPGSPERARALAAIDAIVEETLRLEAERGHQHFLMPYGRHGGWKADGRSVFVDGEVALMLGARRLVEERADWRPLLAERAERIVRALEGGPVLSGESYPDECWTFCNAAALAALRVHDALDRADHGPLARRWVETARARLVEPTTGLLVSRYAWDGRVMEGPEGSSIWMVVHCLALVDEAFARDQYERARRELAIPALGFGLAREWPRSLPGHPDVDSGPIVPVLEASAGSSGLAFLGASTFGDRTWLRALQASLDLAGFPVEDGEGLRYAASNQVGDAVLLYAMVQGPLWAKVREALR